MTLSFCQFVRLSPTRATIAHLLTTALLDLAGVPDISSP